MKGLLDKTKQAVVNVGDKMKLTAASKAPQENDGFKELVEDLKKYQHQIHDLEEKLKQYVGAASRLVQMAENMAGAADKVSYTSGLSASVDAIDCGPMKAVIESFKERCERVRQDIGVMDEELRSLHGHVDERNKAGAAYEKERKKAESLESKHDPKATVARSEADRACDHYRSVHESTLRELQAWKSNASSRYQPVHSEVTQVMQAFFSPGGGGVHHGSTFHSSSSSSSSTVASKTSSSANNNNNNNAASSPAKVVAAEPAKPSPAVYDNYNPPPPQEPAPSPRGVAAAPAAPKLPRAVAQWDFTAETAEEVSFKAGDIIMLQECVDGEEWWKGQVVGTSLEGLFPASYVLKKAD